MFEILGSQFFRTTTRMQSGPVKVSYNVLNNNLQSYTNVMPFQISSRRESR